MRYSAFTSSPRIAQQEQFTLRQMLYSKPRPTEIVIVVPVSSSQEDEYLAETLKPLFKYGRVNISKSRQVLSLLGIFQNGLMVGKFQGKDVHAHIFEYTTQVCLDPLVDPASSAGSLETPVQMLFCIKEKNEGREESHRWLSQAIFPALQPQMFMFILPGLHPRRDAIYRMLREIDSHQSCGEAIGQITPNGSSLDWLRYPLAAVSALEQRLIYTFDKPIESGLGQR
ncbi:chitin synthase I [Penicillium manginii]|uniref:chitin synthase I n=1 Tax=Penicillium manginii TaxID=203109 RepID=UPI002548EEBD|nr:chitin synthase I [Penicillium manginii]KAJ5743681.1 chitin synthase I [Penicillium manginii]